MLGVIMIVSVAACGGSGNNDPEKDNESGSHGSSPGITETITETDTYLFKDGVSEYKIVIPEAAGISTKFAAEELKYFIKDANGFEMEVITDAGLTFNSNDKYISVGDTTIADGAGLTATEDEVGWDGYKIKTYGNTVVLVSSSDNGSINAAYGWLQRNMGYKYYADDEWSINTAKDIKLLNIEAKEKPTFNGRWIDFAGNGMTSTDYDLARWFTRTRQTGGMGGAANGRTADWANNNDQSMESQIWSSGYAVGVTQTHSQTGEKVAWTRDNGTMDVGQICLSTLLDGLGSGSGVDLLGKNEAFTSFATCFVNKSFAPETDNRIFFLGINDNRNKCQCKECTAYYGAIRESGLMVKFTNAINDVFKAWLANELNGQVYTFENYSKSPSYQFTDSPVGDEDRTYLLGFFSYMYTIDSPTEWKDSLGDYVVKDDVETVYDGNGGFSTRSLGRKVACADEVMVRIAPIDDVNGYSHNDAKHNPLGTKSFNSWAKCTQHLTVWDYGTNFNAYLAPYPDWSTLQENFLLYEEKGVLDIFTQLAAHTDGVAFNRMMVYLRTQLMWNAHQDVETLIDNFINAYYKDAGPIIKEYFNYMRSEYEILRLKGSTEQGGYDGKIYGKVLYTIWDYAQVLQMKSFFDRAFAAIEPLKTTDYETYSIVYKRLTTESLFYRYVLIDRFSSYYPTSVRSDMIDEFEIDAKNANLTSVGRLVGQAQGGTGDRIDVIIPAWRSSKI